MLSEVSAKKKERYKWIILLIATLSQMCATFVTYGMGPLASFYQQKYDLSQFETGLIVSAVNIGPIFSMLIFGNLMDKYGERWVVGLGSILLGLNILAAYTTDNYFLLLVILASSL
ncbi:MFS transporter [Bacillus aerolatus]|nr:MFS transporter [Bacillus aerolatus]